MNILVVCQNYAPEPYILNKVCEELVRRGHQVTVLTGIPNYPMGKIYPGYGWGKKKREGINGVDVRRCFTIARRHGAVFRLLNYDSFMISSSIAARRLREKFDCVLCYQTSPVMMAQAGVKYAAWHGIPCCLYCLDAWPACLEAGGITPGSPVFRHYENLSKKIYSGADVLLVSSRSFVPYLSEHFGIDRNRMQLLRQPPWGGEEKVRAEVTERDATVFLFAGNIGKAQNVPVILRCARRVQDAGEQGRKIRFLIAGDGSELAACRRLAAEYQLDNVEFLGRLPASQMPALYQKASAMLVTLTGQEFANMTLPGKVQSYMAAGKPILSSAGGETTEVITSAGCGYAARANDDAELYENVMRFAGLSQEEADRMGKASKAYYERNFTAERFFDTLEAHLIHLVQRDGV